MNPMLIFLILIAAFQQYFPLGLTKGDDVDTVIEKMKDNEIFVDGIYEEDVVFHMDSFMDNWLSENVFSFCNGKLCQVTFVFEVEDEKDAMRLYRKLSKQLKLVDGYLEQEDFLISLTAFENEVILIYEDQTFFNNNN